MKKLLLFYWLCVAVIMSLDAQIEIPRNVCYTEEMVERISVAGELDVSALTILDKLKFKEKRYQKKHHIYFDKEGNAKHDVHFVSHKNMFPAWYTHPSTIRIDRDGTKSYYVSKNKYLVDGWPGGSKQKTDHGEYVHDARTGEKYLYQRHSPKAQQAYESWNDDVNKQGALKRFVFAPPTTSELKDVQNRGYRVIASKDEVSMKKGNLHMRWDKSKKVLIEEMLEEEVPVKRVTRYELNKELNQYLVSSIVTSRTEKFSNNRNYAQHSQSFYKNYSKNCGHDTKAQVRDNSPKFVEESNLLKISPNPSYGRVSLIVPKSKFKTTMQVMNIAGDILIQRQLDKEATTTDFDVTHFPSGIYIIKCAQGDKLHLAKFTKK